MKRRKLTKVEEKIIKAQIGRFEEASKISSNLLNRVNKSLSVLSPDDFYVDYLMKKRQLDNQRKQFRDEFMEAENQLIILKNQLHQGVEIKETK